MEKDHVRDKLVSIIALFDKCDCKCDRCPIHLAKAWYELQVYDDTMDRALDYVRIDELEK